MPRMGPLVLGILEDRPQNVKGLHLSPTNASIVAVILVFCVLDSREAAPKLGSPTVVEGNLTTLDMANPFAYLSTQGTSYTEVHPSRSASGHVDPGVMAAMPDWAVTRSMDFPGLPPNFLLVHDSPPTFNTMPLAISWRGDCGPWGSEA